MESFENPHVSLEAVMKEKWLFYRTDGSVRQKLKDDSRNGGLGVLSEKPCAREGGQVGAAAPMLLCVEEAACAAMRAT